jgi:hypothetical protein
VTSTYRSVSHDETTDTQLYNRDIQEALAGQRLDVIGYDACLMAMVETGYAMRKGEVGAIMVASEELEPGDGWQYDDWLPELVNNPAMDGRELGRVLVRSYQRVFGLPGSEETLSEVDLSRVEAAASAISALADGLIAKLPAQRTAIRRARNDCAVYAPGRQLYHIDFAHFCDRLIARSSDAQLDQLARAARDAVKATVVQNFAGDQRAGGQFGSHGLAIYFPATGGLYERDPYEQDGYKKDNTFKPVDFVRDHRWADFLHAYFAAVP